MKYLISLIVICFSLTYSYSQELQTIQGIVIDGYTKDSLPKTNIINFKQLIGTSTNDKGKFEIEAKEGDTLIISYVGYQPLKLSVNKALLDAEELKISLYERQEILPEVSVKSSVLSGVLEIDVRKVPEEKFTRVRINGIPQSYEVGKPIPKSKLNLLGAIFSPIDFLYEKYGKEPSALRKVRKMRESNQIRKLLSNRFDRVILLDYLKINENELNKILEDCDYSNYFSVSPSLTAL